MPIEVGVGSLPQRSFAPSLEMRRIGDLALSSAVNATPKPVLKCGSEFNSATFAMLSFCEILSGVSSRTHLAVLLTVFVLRRAVQKMFLKLES